MSLPIKAGIATITLGTVGGVTYFGSTYISNNNKELDNTKQTTEISKLIENSLEYVLLNTADTANSDDKYWGENWKSYEADSKQLEKDIFGLTGWNKTNPTDLTSLLKEKCGTESKKSVLSNTDSVYQNVAKYCTRGVTIEEDMKNKKIALLVTDTGGKDAGIWTSRHGKRASLQSTLSKLGVTEQGDAITEEKIRNACSTSKAKHKKEKDYETTIEAFKAVCIRQSDDQ